MTLLYTFCSVLESVDMAGVSCLLVPPGDVVYQELQSSEKVRRCNIQYLAADF